jgi:hypothetical protein
MSETYRRPTLIGWLVPASIGPFVVAYVAAILGAAFGPVGGHLRWVVLVVGLAVATLWASVYVLLATIVDVALLSMKVRTLPTGKNGWIQGFAAPAASLAMYAIHPPHKWFALGPWAVVIAVLVPPVIAIALSRIFLGKKPG